MSAPASALTDSGSMMPLFVGLAATSLVIALGAAEVCASYLFRENLQASADQLALVSLQQQVQDSPQAAKLLAALESRASLRDFRITDGATVELKVCSDWQGWLRLEGLGGKQTICVESAAR